MDLTENPFSFDIPYIHNQIYFQLLGCETQLLALAQVYIKEVHISNIIYQIKCVVLPQMTLVHACSPQDFHWFSSICRYS